jgi:hypothetical protein
MNLWGDGGPVRTRTWDKGKFTVATIQLLAGPDGETRVKVRCKLTQHMVLFEHWPANPGGLGKPEWKHHHNQSVGSSYLLGDEGSVRGS